jgi:hypothetical protein
MDGWMDEGTQVNNCVKSEEIMEDCYRKIDFSYSEEGIEMPEAT